MTITSDQLFALVSAILLTLLGGGLLGAIYTGRATKAQIEKSGADTLETYQKIAALASASELQARNERSISQQRCDEVMQRLEIANETYLRENAKLKEVLSQWSCGITRLHNQITEMDKDTKPVWSPKTDDLTFLVKEIDKENI